jgi:hypothetical protein
MKRQRRCPVRHEQTVATAPPRRRSTSARSLALAPSASYSHSWRPTYPAQEELRKRWEV